MINITITQFLVVFLISALFGINGIYRTIKLARKCKVLESSWDTFLEAWVQDMKLKYPKVQVSIYDYSKRKNKKKGDPRYQLIVNNRDTGALVISRSTDTITYKLFEEIENACKKYTKITTAHENPS